MADEGTELGACATVKKSTKDTTQCAALAENLPFSPERHSDSTKARENRSLCEVSRTTTRCASGERQWPVPESWLLQVSGWELPSE